MYVHPRTSLLVAGMLLLVASSAAQGAFKDIPPSKDNTLYQSATGALSNGAGEYLFTGRTDKGLIRRAIIAFAIADSIPVGSTVDSVVLNLFLSRSKLNSSKSTAVYRVLNTWGEARSNAPQNEGEGAPADTGDATWVHRLRYPDVLWSAVGGDFDPIVRATTGVASNNFYRWNSALMTADVQSWLNNPATNNGWLIRGEELVNTTATRFNSRQNTDTTRRPYLRVYYTPAGGDPTGACCLPLPISCDILTQIECLAQGGTYQGDNTDCIPDPCAGPSTTVTVTPSKDNTLYESATGALSNGLGTKVLASKSTTGFIRRGVVSFSLMPAIPPGATVTNAILTLYNVQAGTNAATVTVHKATADWGEGSSLAAGDEDAGAPSTTGDATWTHRFYPGTNWTTSGGDFVVTESAATSVATAGFYSWTSASLIADVQGWLNNPTTNFGWVIRGKETGPGNALKSFESLQSIDPTRRPKLEITYLAPTVPTGACSLPDGSCDTLTAAECIAAGGTYQGDNTACVGTPGIVLEPFVDPLPLPAVAVPTSGTIGGAASYQIAVTEFKQRLHRDLPLTTVWGYGGSYPGPTIVASAGNMVDVTWINDLRDSTNALRSTHYLPVDLCVHGPDMEGPSARIVTHLHGGHVEPGSDGYPTQTSLPGQRQTFHYPNNQLPGTLWYHDHALGITRLNVIMGMAGFYLLTDASESALGLPSGEYEVGLAIQDRTFNADGSLQYPAVWQDHWFGDKAVVNGKVWPYFNVKRGKYRFRLLNGSTSRVYTLKLSNGAPFTQLGTEGGLLTSPVTRDSITITPGERVDAIIDFAPFPAGTEIILANSASAPFPIGDPMEPALPSIMKFVVQSASGHTAPIPAALRPVTPLVEADSLVHRDFVLAKTPGPAPCGGSIWTINGGTFDDVTEFPVLGSTEVWRFINRSGSIHPMHMHLTMFQILDRQPFVIQADTIALVGSPIPPGPEEAGWKDTAPVYPNQVMRVITRFEDYAGRYVYHCHILEHEENEMMRQFHVVHGPVTSVTNASPPARYALHSAVPNPFNPRTRIGYELRKAGHARIDVFDVAGRFVATLLDAKQPAGVSSVTWDGKTASGTRAASGVYSYRLQVRGEAALTRKMVVLK